MFENLMSRSKSLLLFPAVLVVGLALAATQWVMQPKQSELTFTAIQAGAPFQGKFEEFEADIRFDPDVVADRRFEIKIQPASVRTKDREREDILRRGHLFAVHKWPTATYVAERFEHRGVTVFAT